MWRPLCLAIVVWTSVTSGKPEGLDASDIATFQSRNSGVNCGASFSMSVSQTSITITASGTPDHQFACVNPNAPQDQSYSLTFPRHPVKLSTPKCLNTNAIAIAINGVAFFNPLTANGDNAVEGTTAEDFDCCYGHADESGGYHYHQLPSGSGCNNPVYNASNGGEQLIGMAWDGFPIYSKWTGLLESDLDECHGYTLSDGRYVYVATETFPYIMGCFWGEPSANSMGQASVSLQSGTTGYLYDCLHGTGTYASTTTRQLDDKKTSGHDDDLVQQFLEYLLDRESSRRRERRSTGGRFVYIDERSTLDSCYSSSCDQTNGFSYDSTAGTCSFSPPSTG